VRSVEISNVINLKSIGLFSLTPTSKYITKLSIVNAPYFWYAAQSIWDAASLLPNLRELKISKTGMTYIPNEAIRNLNGFPADDFYNDLRIEVTDNFIKEVKSKAFGLNRIGSINLSGNPVHTIQSYAFAKTQTKKPHVHRTLFITIHSTSDFFTSRSFKLDSLLGTQMKVKLQISGPKFNSLSQIPFAIYLLENKEHKLVYKQNTKQLECGCNMIWLHLEKEKFQNQIWGIKADDVYEKRGELICKDGRNFFDLTIQDFAHCTGQQFVSSESLYASAVNAFTTA